VLARLQQVDGLEAAEVDHSGELLRVALAGPDALAAVRATMRELGYDAVEGATAPADARWYSGATARDLSREEAGVIAARVVPPFARLTSLATGDADRLRGIVADALYGVFSTHALHSGADRGTLRGPIFDAVRDAATPLIGADAADALVGALRSDLDRAAGGER
jgi:hypothetical protein